ncbi:OsmC family protein [Peptostreptococcaceae bacterium OttesenSCG-928-C18]|nr:OsmC family protein [Peptostreptococcaceae bacterium OttesenSCG-928-C18]
MAMKYYSSTIEAGEDFEAICKAGEYEIILDQGKQSGGNGKGMTPVEAFLSSIGGCMTVNAKIFSKKLRIDLKSFKLKIDGEVDSDKGKGLSKIKITYFIESNSEREQIDKFIDLVERYCTVKATMLEMPELETKVNIIK